jgi:hypothetical protein
LAFFIGASQLGEYYSVGREEPDFRLI